jgi:predicted ATPase
MGRIGEAAKLTEDAVRQSREARHLFSLAFALTVGAGSVYHYRREPQIVRVYTEEAIALSEENGFTEWLNRARFYHGWALVELGELELGIAEMEASIVRGPWPQYMNALLGRAYAAIGRMGDALASLNNALVRVEETGEKDSHAEILRLKGEVLLMQNAASTAETEGCFRAALEVARAQNAKWLELRSTVSLARLLRDNNRHNEARTMLAEIYNWFTEGFDTADLKEAKALLEELT